MSEVFKKMRNPNSNSPLRHLPMSACREAQELAKNAMVEDVAEGFRCLYTSPVLDARMDLPGDGRG